MPSTAPSVKKEAVQGYGAIVTECTPTLEARQNTVNEIVQRLESEGKVVEFISPYDDARVIAGQGTLTLELLEQAAEMGKELDVLITPVGGGGMLSGCAVAAKGKNPNIWVAAAEPKGADDAHRSFYSKEFYPSLMPQTIADGLLTSLGKHTFPLILQHVDAIYTVAEDEIIRATRFVFERMKIVIEPSSAVTLAAVLYSADFHQAMKELSLNNGGRRLNVGIVFSGGNVDLKLIVGLFDSLGAS
ncbi:hypothetical protein FRC03_004281 [Tulasnella sp. 419]|nr:hypothetical protein FRC03_004281 [Tulasnella sp. 419]